MVEGVNDNIGLYIDEDYLKRYKLNAIIKDVV